jgi:hypothetical protein
MKKIFTLLVALGMITLAQAQHGSGRNSRDHRNDQPSVEKDYDNGYGNDRGYNGIMSPKKQLELAIDRVNREYDWKIEKVKDNFFKSRSQKKREIRFLNEQRKREIRRTYAEFSKERRDRDYPNRRY